MKKLTSVADLKKLKQQSSLASNSLARQKINAIVCQTGCMSYCYAEPTVEITLAGEEPVVFGFVNSAKAQEIIEKYIIQHQLIDGIIPASYKTV